MRRKLFTSKQWATIFLLLFSVAFFWTNVSAQEQNADLAKIESEIAARKTKLADAAFTGQEREKVLQETASLLNQVGEIRFAKGEYETATKIFVEADQTLRQYHESYYARMKAQLAEAEAKLPEYDKEPNAEKRAAMYKIGRILVSVLLSEVIKEAGNLGDHAAAKIFLQRYGEVAREVKNTKEEAESYEKLGDIEFNADNNQQAFELYDKALALRKGTNREWWTIDYIASARWSLGEYNKAADLYKEEIEILRKLEGEAARGCPIARFL